MLLEVAERMQDNYPYQHPLYAGQMLKPPHPIARLSYALAQYVNPNNHALDGGRASSHMEKEAVAQIAAMFGWTTHLGHLTSGGTMANLEALWVCREAAPRQENRRLGAGALHPQPHLRSARLAVRGDPGGWAGAHGLGRAGSGAASAARSARWS